MNSLGTCYGYDIHSTMDLSYLRGGKGQRLHVSVVDVDHPVPDEDPLLEWSPRDHPFGAALWYLSGGLYQLWVDDMGWFRIDPQGLRIEVPVVTDLVRLEERIWGIPALLCFLERGDLPLNAAAVEIDGRAIILAAPGRAGKTTLVGACAVAGLRVLSEDLTCIRLDGPPAVVPGPAMIRLREDAASHLKIPGRVVGQSNGRVHIGLDSAERGTCEPVPLAGIFLLGKSAEEVTIEAHPPVDALSDLWALSFRISTDADQTRCFNGVVDLVSEVPVYDLYRPLTFETLPQVVRALEGSVLQGS